MGVWSKLLSFVYIVGLMGGALGVEEALGTMNALEVNWSSGGN